MLDLHRRYMVDERGVDVVVPDGDEYEILLLLAEMKSPDPDEGLVVKPEIVERVKRQRAEFEQGKRGKSLNQVMRNHL